MTLAGLTFSWLFLEYDSDTALQSLQNPCGLVPEPHSKLCLSITREGKAVKADKGFCSRALFRKTGKHGNQGVMAI